MKSITEILKDSEIFIKEHKDNFKHYEKKSRIFIQTNRKRKKTYYTHLGRNGSETIYVESQNKGVSMVKKSDS